MRLALKGFERRLARVALWIGARTGDVERERQLYRAREVMASLIREGLARAGLDPAESVALRRFAAPEPPRPRPRPMLRRIDPREAFLEQMRALAARMRQPPPLATASPAELFAYYCCGDGAKEAPA